MSKKTKKVLIIIAVIIAIIGVAGFLLKDKLPSLTMKLMFSQETVNYTEYSNGEKEILFIPTVHVGKEEYYQNIKQAITEAKEDGSVYFYEWVDYENSEDEVLRKARKMLGIIATPEYYEKWLIEADVADSLIAQPQDNFLNIINDKDYNVDLSPEEIVSAYEDKYGEIILSEKDMQTPLTEDLEEKLDSVKVDDIILNVRNEHLVEEILNGEHDKIIITYGADHEQGVIDLLVKADPNWKETDTLKIK